LRLDKIKTLCYNKIIERLCEVVGLHWSESAEKIKETVIAD
jgi:hypothetical protein